MKFAFIIMGKFDVWQDRVQMHEGMAQFIGVANLDEACQVATELSDIGVGCIELCGAFGVDGAKKIIAATKGRIPVGYVVHLPEQNELYKQAFAD